MLQSKIRHRAHLECTPRPGTPLSPAPFCSTSMDSFQLQTRHPDSLSPIFILYAPIPTTCLLADMFLSLKWQLQEGGDSCSRSPHSHCGHCSRRGLVRLVCWLDEWMQAWVQPKTSWLRGPGSSLHSHPTPAITLSTPGQGSEISASPGELLWRLG